MVSSVSKVSKNTKYQSLKSQQIQADFLMELSFLINEGFALKDALSFLATIMPKEIEWIEQIIQKFSDIEMSFLVKLLSSLGAERPLLFLYYIIQIIDYNNLHNKKPINSHILYLCSIIEKFPVWKFFINQAVFTKRIQNKFIETIKTKFNEKECKMIISESKNILEYLKIKLPRHIVSGHKLKSSQLEQALLSK